MRIKFSYLTLLFTLLSTGAHASEKFLFHPKGANFFVYGRGGKNFVLHRSKLARWRLHKNITKLSSAKRIVSAADDPAGLAVAEKMSSFLNSLKQEALNAEDYRNYLKYYEGMIAQDQELLNRIRVLILKSSGGILGPEDREINQSEINQFLRQIDMNAQFSQFNRKLVIPGLNVKGLGLSGVNVVTNLYNSIKLVDIALKKLIKLRSAAGAKTNMLTFQIKGKHYYYMNLLQAESRIRDLDMAEEISDLIKNNVLLKTDYGIIIKAK